MDKLQLEVYNPPKKRKCKFGKEDIIFMCGVWTKVTICDKVPPHSKSKFCNEYHTKRCVYFKEVK